MHSKSLAALALVLAAGGAQAADQTPPKLTPSQAKTLAKALDGKVAGKPVSCVSIMLGSSGGPQALSDDILLYRVNKDLTYRNDLLGSCNGLSSGNTMVLKPTVDQYCRGDIVRVVDFTIHMPMGSCALGDFVPYRSVPK